MFSVRWAARFTALLSASAALAGCEAPAQYDLILRGGTIVDGTGTAPYAGDVAIEGDRIAAVGDLGRSVAVLEMEVAGLVVAPGFINLHSHARPEALPTAVNMLSQGVTTEILNPDGGGPLDLGAQLLALREGGLAVNVGAFLGFNRVWSQVVGAADRPATEDEVGRMQALVEAGLQEGAWGVSAGLDYKPAYFASTEEVVRVLEPARRWRTVFSNHDRLTPETRYSSRAGIDETLEIGVAAGLTPVVTHMKIQGWEQGRAAEVLARMSGIEVSGAPAAADVYPYLAGQTGLGALIIPGWAQEGGRDAMLARFRDPALRARVVAEAEEAMVARFGGPSGVYLPQTQRELVDVMAEMGITSGGEAVVRLLEQGSPRAILRFGSEEDLVAILRHPTSSVACDCGASTAERGHPRGWGTYPRVLGRYVRDQGVLTLEDAVRKMTNLPAETIGMDDRGTLAVGMAADVVVFDPTTVIDHATYEDPDLQSDGIVHVVVNGELAWRDGAATGARPGRTLRRPPPSE